MTLDIKGNLHYFSNLKPAISIFKVEEIVENGEIPAEDIHLPGVYVKGLLTGSNYEKRIEVSYLLPFLLPCMLPQKFLCLLHE